MLALWLPATLHCELEWAGIFSDCVGCHDHDEGDGQDNDADACATVEGGAIQLRSPASLVKTSDAGLLYILLLVSPTGGDAPPVRVMCPTRARLDVARVWHFVERAAPPSRAPTFIV